jgi:lipopolysaccharide transport system ATP-binding protein
MTDIAIRCEGLAKQYRIGERQSYKAIRDVITDAFASPFRRLRSALRQSSNGSAGGEEPNIWALNDVSFEIKRGEVVGIIGRNGAGKSTLLKILSRITEPTRGSADIWGRVGSLLEVGTGFHPELTGRDNIFLNGAILGMRRAEIARKFDEIVAFAEVEKFIDTPVKRYSSGMYVRLAFAVAAHMETEILMVDEVLAVGDAQFQKKCLNKMQNVGEQGRTVVFVSHNMTAVQRLCQRAVWLDSGLVLKAGHPGVVVDEYLKTGSSTCTHRFWGDFSSAPGNEAVRIQLALVRPADGTSSSAITVEMPFVIEFQYWNLNPGAHLNLSLHILNEDGTCAFNTAPVFERRWHGKAFPAGLFRSVCHVPGNLMNDGTHRIQLLVVQNSGHIIYRHDDIISFDVQESVRVRDGYLGKWPGAVRPQLDWDTEFLQAK